MPVITNYVSSSDQGSHLIISEKRCASICSYLVHDYSLIGKYTEMKRNVQNINWTNFCILLMYVQKIKTSHIPWPVQPLKYHFKTYISRWSQQEFFSFKIMGFDTNYTQKTAIWTNPIHITYVVAYYTSTCKTTWQQNQDGYHINHWEHLLYKSGPAAWRAMLWRQAQEMKGNYGMEGLISFTM